MARIRTIKPEFWVSEQVVSCSRDARLFFIGIWNFADDGGVIPLSPRGLKMQIFPGDDFTDEEIRRLVGELSANGLVALFTHSGKDYIHVCKWDDHQRIEKPTYKHPRPPVLQDAQTPFEPETPQNSTTPLRLVAEDSPTSLLRKGMEGKGMDSIGGECEGRDEPAIAEPSKPTPKQLKEKIPPDPELANEYAASLGMSQTETNKWRDHYQSNGWKVGRNPMKDWRASMRNWHSGRFVQGTTPTRAPSAGGEFQGFEVIR